MPEPIAVAYIIGKIKETATERIKAFASEQIEEARHWSDNRKLFPKIREFVAATTKRLEQELDSLLEQVQREFEKRDREAADALGRELHEVRVWLDQLLEKASTFKASMGVHSPALDKAPALSVPPGHAAARALRAADAFARSLSSGTFSGTERTGIEVRRSATTQTPHPSVWDTAVTQAREHIEAVWGACEVLAAERGIHLGDDTN